MISPKKQNIFIAVALALLFTLFCAASLNFMSFVQQSLWDNAVKHVMESTARAANALQRNAVKDLELLRMLAQDLEQGMSSDEQRIIGKLQTHLSGTGSLAALIFKDGTGYTDTGLAVTLTPEERKLVQGLNKQGGMLPPYRNRGSGRRTLTIYTPVKFPDGREAHLFKGYNVESLYAAYALSFYNNTGFAYVTLPGGEIIMRSLHPASNKTFTSLFDIINGNGNRPEVIEAFRDSLKNGKTGVAVFNDADGENVFCYVPMPDMEGWYLVSIIPNAVIMKEANAIILRTLLLCGLLFAGLLAVFFIYRRLKRGYQREIRALAFTDTLTGIRNFTKFKIDGDALLQAPDAPHYAVLTLDILNFQVVNEVLGYNIGDALLQRLALLLGELARPGALTARVNGDHFVVLLPYDKKQDLTAYCDALLRALNGYARSQAGSYHIELRTGICCAEDGDAATGINDLLDRANIALKAIKAKGAQPWNFYDSGMRVRILREKELEMRMGRALRDGEFQIHIQPKYRLDSLELAGGEALVRWQSPDHGFLPPAEFIPLFEKNRFIIQLDQYVFTAVCRLLRQWLDAGVAPCPLAVNVSRVQFYTLDFVETYIGIKKRYDIPDGLLELEFTESIFIENVELLRTAVQELRQAGFSCAIDDFGAGYSSLNILKDLPVDVLKLDGVFFRSLKSNGRDKVVIQNIVHMAGELQMATVAEGVETLEQVNFLKDTNCDMVQGYVFARPMPAEKFAERLRNSGDTC